MPTTLKQVVEALQRAMIQSPELETATAVLAVNTEDGACYLAASMGTAGVDWLAKEMKMAAPEPILPPKFEKLINTNNLLEPDWLHPSSSDYYRRRSYR